MLVTNNVPYVVGAFMICLHTKLHCSCVGVLVVVIDINRKVSERPPSCFEILRKCFWNRNCILFRFTTHRVRYLNCLRVDTPTQMSDLQRSGFVKRHELIPGFVKTCQQIQN